MCRLSLSLAFLLALSFPARAGWQVRPPRAPPARRARTRVQVRGSVIVGLCVCLCLCMWCGVCVCVKRFVCACVWRERERERKRASERARAQTSEGERATERERSLMRVVCSQRESERAQKESASGKARERVGRETDRTRRRSSNAGHGGVAMAALLPLLVSPCVTGACCDYLAGASSCSGSACAAGKYGQEAAASSSAATCTSCVAGTYSSAGASRVCLLRCPLFPAHHNVQTDIPYSTCMHAGVLSRANGPLTAVLRPVRRRLCNHRFCTCCTHDADRVDGGHNTHTLTP